MASASLISCGVVGSTSASCRKFVASAVSAIDRREGYKRAKPVKKEERAKPVKKEERAKPVKKERRSHSRGPGGPLPPWRILKAEP